ncbi:tripartite motif-containing protein 2-like [Anneissia japonica]|uniref:tripartite motif-containing protein 2-like n=1 Tax=Anneissia japonica TaxID=1529436 RepID=UPI0014254E4F|nr:tripartite motif-containing protein 2-like [Anneissia japonica]
MATSELNQFLETVDQKVLECAICMKRLQNPKSLNCLHSYCLACLEDWVKAKGKLTCPTCSSSYAIPEGGLKKLPPNTFVNNLLETIEHISKRDQMKCVCAKGQAKYYCQECRHYLCSSCSDHHKIFPMLANHKLHTVEDVRSMTPQDFAALHPPLCSVHNKPFEFYCADCKTPICINCTVMDHKEQEGKHKPINISKAFQSFKETSKKLEEAAYKCENQLQDGLKAVIEYATNLEKSKDTSLRDIDNHVQVMVKKMKESGDKMKNEVETIYKEKKKAVDVQISELNTTISDLNKKISLLNHLSKSDEATALQSSETVITALNDRIKKLPKTKPSDNRQIIFQINEHQIASLQQCNIGNVTLVRAADCLQLQGMKSVTQGQTIVVKIIKTDECEIQANQLKATWTQPTGETSNTQVDEDDNGDYFVTGKCTSPGICKLDVTADCEQIKQSPMVIEVEKEGIVKTIKINKYVKDIVKCEDDCLLVSCKTNTMLKYKQSGECIGNVTLPAGVKVCNMYKMKNGNIAFNNWGNNCITICNMNSQVIKLINNVELNKPFGIHVDEASNILYVGFGSEVLLFNIDSGQKIRSIWTDDDQEGQISGVSDFSLTNHRNIIILDFYNNRVQLFDNEGRFMKVLVKAGDEDGKVMKPWGVVVDQDDNIIISSEHKIQLFSSDGNFIKRIDKQEDGIKTPLGLSIISYYPRRVAVANRGDKTIKIFNY